MRSSPTNNSRQEWMILMIVLISTLVLVSPRLMPAFDEINAFDEAKYIDSGQSLTRGEVRDISWAPAVAVIYAVLHLALGSNPDWFILEAWAGRFVLYALIWISIMVLSTRLRAYVHPFVTSGILLVTLGIFPVLENQSDALFLALSSLCLGITYRVLKEHRLRDISIASLLLGIAILTRVESILTFGAFVLLVVFLEWKHHPPLKLILTTLVPAILILLLYVLVFSISGGKLEAGLGGKAWASFVTNQPVPRGDGTFILSGGTGGGASEEAIKQFGTQEENGGSVVRAVLGNPSAFIQRIWINIKVLPDYFLDFFGKRQGPIIAVLTVIGVAALIKKKEFGLLAVGLVWAIPALVSLAFLSRHFVPQLTGMILILCAVGVGTMTHPILRRTPIIVFLAANILLFLYGWFGSKPAFLVAGFVVLVTGLISLLIESANQPNRSMASLFSLLLLIAGMVLREPYQFPNLPVYGQSPREQAVHYLHQSLPEGSRILSANALVTSAAGMIDVRSLDTIADVQDSEDFYAALKSEGIKAVILDSVFGFRDKAVDGYVRAGISHYLRVGFEDPSGITQILLVQ